MAYLIFNNEAEDVLNSLAKIAENDINLNFLTNGNLNSFKIIDINNSDFNLIKLNKKIALSYNGNVVNYNNIVYSVIDPAYKDAYINQEKESDFKFPNDDTNNYGFYKKELRIELEHKKNILNIIINNPLNKNSPLLNKAKNYSLYINSLNLNNVEYPLLNTLEGYIDSLGQIEVINPLQLF